jgi:hypothetical protein
MDDDVIACADIVRRGDPDRFLSVMAAPVAARERLFPVYAFNLEVARAPLVTQEPMIAEMRLQWWRDALEEIREGGHVRRHEVVTPLARTIDGESAGILDTLIEARRWDVFKDPFEDEAHLRRYLDATAAGLLVVAARSLGNQDDGPVRDAGLALGIANWLRAVPGLEDLGRIPLVDGRPDAVRALAQEGLVHLNRARKRRGDVAKAARPAMLSLWQTGEVLSMAAKDPGRVADGALEPRPLKSRFGLMVRAATGLW